MRVVTLEEIPESQALRSQWNALVQEMERPEVFYTYEWALAVQKAYGASLSPILLLGYDDDSLTGIAAFARDQRESVVFLAGTTADYCDLVSLPGKRAEWVDTVLSTLHMNGYRTVVLANLPADSNSTSPLKRICARHGYRLLLRPAYSCARVVLDGEESRQSLKRKMSNKKIRRSLNMMAKEAPVAVQHHTGWEEIQPILPALFAAHVARFRATGRVSNLERLERCRFLYELARELSRSGWLVLSRLLVGDTCAAWNYGFRFSRSWFWYLPTFHMKYELHSPGFCLLAKIVESACEAPDTDVVDLGLGGEDYKDRMATADRRTLHATLNGSLAKHARTVLRYRSANMAKASPLVENTLRTLLGELRKFRLRWRKSFESRSSIL